MLSSFAFNFNLRLYTLATMVLACDLTLPAGLFMPTILWGRAELTFPPCHPTQFQTSFLELNDIL